MRSVLSSRLLSGSAALFIVLSAVGAAPVLAEDSVAGAADVTITIASGLSDREVRVAAGDVVRFVNRDGERHRMRSQSGPDEFDTGNLEPGESYQVRLSVAGTYAYLDERDEDAAAYRGVIVVGSGGSSGGGSAVGGSSGGGAPTGGGATSGGAAASGVPSTATVSIGDDFYQPTSIRVAVGGTVTFSNSGGDEHSATSTAFDTGVLGGGASARETFQTAGTFAFLCIFHSDMRGSIEVVADGGGVAVPPVATPAVPAPTPAALPAPTSGAVPAPTSAAGPADGGAPAEVAVDAADFEFRPATIEVAAGGRVTWTNRGVAPHSATAADGGFDSGMVVAGATFTHTFDAPGSYEYLCAFHPEMRATIQVVAPTSESSATTAPAAPAGATDPAAPTGQPAPAGQAAASPEAAAASRAASIDPAATTDVSNLAGIVLTITLVSVAAALFSKAINGTVRSPD